MEQQEKVSLSFFFPAYNEEKTIEPLVRAAQEVLEEICDDYEIIIVDDGSTDRTGEIADRLASGSERIRVIHHPRNRGYGVALRSGFRSATKDLVFYTDGDFQFDVRELKKLLPLIKNADIVSGYKIKRADKAYRDTFSWVFNMLCRTLFHLEVKDVNCAFKLYRRKIFDSMELKSVRGLIDAEVLIKAQRAGYRIVQTGVSHFPRKEGRSKKRLQEIISTIVQMVQLRRELRS